MEICKENKSHAQINQTQRLYKLLYKKDPLLHFQFNFSSAPTSILIDFSDLWSSNLIAFHRASFCLSPHTLFVYLISRPFNTITLLGATSRASPFTSWEVVAETSAIVTPRSQLSPHVQPWAARGRGKQMDAALWHTQTTTALQAHTCLMCSVFYTVISSPVLSSCAAKTLHQLANPTSRLGHGKDTEALSRLPAPPLWLHTLPSLAVTPYYSPLNFHTPL